MNVIATKIQDAVIIEPKVFGDQRGFFLETYQQQRYRELANIQLPFVQDNHSRSSKGGSARTPFSKNKAARKACQSRARRSV